MDPNDRLRIIDMIKEFRQQSDDYTDTGRVWEILDEIERIAAAKPAL